MENILSEVRNHLQQKMDEQIRVASRRFFKEQVKLYGIKMPVVQQIGKVFLKDIREKDKSEIFDLCEELWKSGYMEEAFVACQWTYEIHERYEPSDFKLFKKWIGQYVDNWATCDTFCNHSMGDFIQMYPEFLSQLKEFAKSKNRWMRRASAVSLIIPARKGLFLDDILEIAEILLLDKDDLVRKGYGWMLKAASEAYQEVIFDFVMKNKATMPRTSLRYAIEKMPDSLKVKAMAR